MRNFKRGLAAILLALVVPACGGSAGAGMTGTGASEGFDPFTAKEFSLSAPADGATGVGLQPTFTWTPSRNAQTYRIQIAASENFANLLVNVGDFHALSYPLPAPLQAGTYWWRVYAVTGNTSTLASGAPRSFNTQVPQTFPRRVAFQSDATNLVPLDTNGRTDVFVRDLTTNTTTRGSIGPLGEEVTFSDSALGAMTADGKYLAFQVYNGVWVRDLDSGTTQVSPPAPPDHVIGGSPAISADGRWVAYTVFLLGGPSDIYVWDRQLNEVKNISLTPGGSASSSGYCYKPAISGNGRFVAWESFKTDLVAGDTNVAYDIFVRDLQTNQTERVSLTPQGAQANSASLSAAISADGRFVVFTSYASNLVTGDVNNSPDIFVRDRQLGTTEMVSVSSSGEHAGPNGGTEPERASISADGRYVAFEHAAGNLVANDTNNTYDIFVRDRTQGTTRRVSVSSAGFEGNGDSRWASITPAGGHVAFFSSASNLVAGDTNGVYDVFLHDLATGVTTRLSVSTGGVEGNQHSMAPTASGP